MTRPSRKSTGVATLLIMLAAMPYCARAQSPPVSAKPEILDRVIAVVNGEILLESDVQEERRFAVLQPYSVPPGQNTAERAARRLIERGLILQQMKDQLSAAGATEQEVQQRVDETRKTLPVCARYHCQTEKGWNNFLSDNDLTEEEVRERIANQLLILKFIEVRFRAGIRVSQPEIQEFYQKTLLPQFEKDKLPPPSLASVSARVEEIVLQQKVNVLLQDWLRSLRAQGSVQILDPAYASLSNAETGTGEDE